MAQLVRCVPCKYENLSLVPGSHVKYPGVVLTGFGEGETGWST